MQTQLCRPGGHQVGLRTNQQAHARPRPVLRRAIVQPESFTSDAPEAAPSASSSSSSCPFLASLPTPPTTQLGWWDRVQGIFNPGPYQKQLLGPGGSSPVVYLPPGPLLQETFTLGDADLAKAVLGGEADGITTTGLGAIPSLQLLLGVNSILTVAEPRHSYLRGLMQPAFSPEAISGALPRVEKVVGGWMQDWANAEGSVKGYEGIKAMTFDFILQAVFDRNFSRDQVLRLSRLFATFSGGFLAFPYWDLPFTPYRAALQAREALVAELMVAVREIRAEQAAGAAPAGVMGMLLAAQDELGNKLSDEELQDNLLVLLLAGHDTSSATLTVAMANLQGHPQVLEKLRQEQGAVTAKHGPQITTSALKDMVYAEAVIRETLRLDNVVSGMQRTALQDMELGGYGVPAGATLQVPFTYLALSDPRWRDHAPGSPLDPATFAPERFLSKEGAKPGWLMPFGYGPRFCLGYNLAMVEMKVFLALLARHYDFEADTNTKWTTAIGKVPNNGLPITVTRRAEAQLGEA